eukprot:613027-Pelagomonas_calceolata.AAC.1
MNEAKGLLSERQTYTFSPQLMTACMKGGHSIQEGWGTNGGQDEATRGGPEAAARAAATAAAATGSW